MSASLSIMGGYCERCSWPKHGKNITNYVFHGTPWCPRFHAIVDVDWNAAREEPEGWIVTALHECASRPVEVGERVLLVCTDDIVPFVTWGRILSTDRVLYCKVEAEGGFDNGFSYAELPEGWREVKAEFFDALSEGWTRWRLDQRDGTAG